MLHRFRMMRLGGAVDPFKPITNLGGGGGSSSNSGGNDALWNAQAEQVKQSSAMSGEMFDYWQKYSPQYLDNANAMTKEAMDGTLTNRARTTAGADADQATAAGLEAATRSLDRYGATVNPNAMAHDSKAVALQGAANKADAMSKATQWGENQKWARNQDAYGLTSGMPGNAVASANSAQAGLNGLSSMQNSQNSIDAANASGYGRAGSTIAYGLFKKDGGAVKSNTYRKPGLNRLAAGGVPKNPVVGWRQRMAAMPTIARTENGSSPIESTLSGAMPTIAGELAKPYLKEAGSAIKDGLADAIGQGRAGLERMAGVDQSQAAVDVIDKSTMATEVAGDTAATAATDAAASTTTDAAATAATDAATTAAAETAATAATDAAATAAAETAAVTAAETAATTAAGTTVAANAWNPIGWIGAGLMAANALSRADGGKVPGLKRIDMTAGGPVSGPGTETSDSIPAWLSDDEYVLNAPAVRMVGKAKLDRINEAGLKKRHGKQARMVDGEAKPNGLASGGMLGIALGAGADTYNALNQQDERNRLLHDEFGLRRTQDARSAEIHDLNVKRIKREAADQDAIQSILAGDKSPGLQRVPVPNVRASAPEMTPPNQLGGNGVEQLSPTANVRGEKAIADSQRPGLQRVTYLDVVGPRVAEAYLRQGKLPEAKAWREFVESEQGRAYANDFARAQHLVTAGNYEGAAPILESLFNNGFPNGQQSKVRNLGDGSFKIDIVDQASGKLLGSQTMPGEEMGKLAIGALNPTKLVEFTVQSRAKQASEAAQLERQTKIEEIRQRGQEVREDRRDERFAKGLEHQSDNLERRIAAQAERGGLTISQQRQNEEIEAAREAIAGLSPQEIARRTAKATDTGRENKDYDPALSRQITLAGRRKLGSDDWFDNRQQRQPLADIEGGPKRSGTTPPENIQSIAERFKADGAMSGYTLGRETPDGVEVLNAGKVIGHYR